jgi:large subunit ribosomal protein L20
MHKAGVALDRKVLAEIALSLPGDFAAVVRASQA